MNTDLNEADCEAWRQKHQTRNPMKTLFYLILAFVLTFFLLGLSGCVETTSTAPDGTVTKIKGPAPGVLQFAGAAITAYSPRAIVVREEKSARITASEIRERWQPVFGPKLP